MTLTFEGTVILPLADPDDGERTAHALAPRLEPTATVVIVNVVEKSGGGIDKAPVGRRQEYAEEIFEAARGPLADSSGAIESDVLYGTDVVETVFDAAQERNADAIAFIPRSGNRLAELFTGDVARRLVREASVPVVSLPQRN